MLFAYIVDRPAHRPLGQDQDGLFALRSFHRLQDAVMNEELYCVEFTFSGARRHELYVRNVWKHEADIHARIAREQGWRDVRVLKMSEYWSQAERNRRDEDWYRYCNEQIGGRRAEKVKEDSGERRRGKTSQGRPYSRTR